MDARQVVVFPCVHIPHLDRILKETQVHAPPYAMDVEFDASGSNIVDQGQAGSTTITD